MTPQIMVQPSTLMSSGIKMSEFGDIYLFKFTDRLQLRFEELLEKKKPMYLPMKKKLNTGEYQS